METTRETIERLLVEKRKTKVELADFLNITPQGLQYKLKEESFKSNDLKELSKFFNIDIKEFLPEYSNKSESLTELLVNKITEEMRLLREQLIMKDRQIDKLLDLLGTRNFRNVSELTPVPYIEKKMVVIYKKENLRVIAKTS